MIVKEKNFLGLEEYDTTTEKLIGYKKRKEKKVVKYRVELDDNQHPTLVEDKELPVDRFKLNSPRKIIDLLNKGFSLNRLGQEEIFIIGVNNQFEPLGIFKVGQGNINSCPVSVRDIFIRAILSGSKFLFIAHNHPSGSVVPSKADYDVCERIKEAGRIMDIQLMDFLITGGDNSYSFRENDEI